MLLPHPLVDLSVNFMGCSLHYVQFPKSQKLRYLVTIFESHVIIARDSVGLQMKILSNSAETEVDFFETCYCTSHGRHQDLSKLVSPNQICTLNIGTLTGKTVELTRAFRKRHNDICALQETRQFSAKSLQSYRSIERESDKNDYNFIYFDSSRIHQQPFLRVSVKPFKRSSDLMTGSLNSPFYQLITQFTSSSHTDCTDRHISTSTVEERTDPLQIKQAGKPEA